MHTYTSSNATTEHMSTVCSRLATAFASGSVGGVADFICFNLSMSWLYPGIEPIAKTQEIITANL